MPDFIKIEYREVVGYIKESIYIRWGNTRGYCVNSLQEFKEWVDKARVCANCENYVEEKSRCHLFPRNDIKIPSWLFEMDLSKEMNPYTPACDGFQPSLNERLENVPLP